MFENNDINKNYLVIAGFKQKASFSVREAGDIVVGKEFTGNFISAELSTFSDITYSTDIIHDIFRVGLTSNIAVALQCCR